jgi:hypothetical protein
MNFNKKYKILCIKCYEFDIQVLARRGYRC